uniref:Apple domain-containing protein n=1 Tax=Panagrellus redivivus TaxID=6233 RepID=A0A7E4W3H5_PANRE
MYLASSLYFIVIQFVRYGSTCIPVRDPGGVVPIEESLSTCAPSTNAASLFVDDSVQFTSSSSLIKKCTTCAGGTVNYYKSSRSPYYTASEIMGSIMLSDCSNLCICTPSGICYVESSSTRVDRSVVRQRRQFSTPDFGTETTTTAATTTTTRGPTKESSEDSPESSSEVTTTTTTTTRGGFVTEQTMATSTTTAATTTTTRPISTSEPFETEAPAATTTTTTTPSPVSRISLYPYCSDGTCAVYGFIESDSVKLIPEDGTGVTYHNSDINVPVTDSSSYINAATVSCDGCIHNSCQSSSG